VALGLVSDDGCGWSGCTRSCRSRLRIMSDVRATLHARAAVLDRLARNSLPARPVRKITRGMWALDLLNDHHPDGVLPSLAVLLGR